MKLFHFLFSVTINGTLSQQKFLGFMLVAVSQNAVDENITIGTFQVIIQLINKSISSRKFKFGVTYTFEGLKHRQFFFDINYFGTGTVVHSYMDWCM